MSFSFFIAVSLNELLPLRAWAGSIFSTSDFVIPPNVNFFPTADFEIISDWS